MQVLSWWKQAAGLPLRAAIKGLGSSQGPAIRPNYKNNDERGDPHV